MAFAAVYEKSLHEVASFEASVPHICLFFTIQTALHASLASPKKGATGK